jgi:protein-S-isoprenylcysteine O-methyltransferase Ste14
MTIRPLNDAAPRPVPALSKRAWTGFVQFQAALALLIFLPAWSLRFWEAWVYWTVFSLCVLFITRYFLERDPALIERRLNVGPAAEHEQTQKIVQAAASVLLCAVFVAAGLDHHFRWSIPIDALWVLVADGLVAAGFLVIFLVFRENSHASAIVEVESGQHVVETGPYRVVRHPMYAGAAVLFMATPVALGSLWALLPAAALSAALVVRLRDEERYLSEHLPGYTRYREAVRHRLLPGIW